MRNHRPAGARPAIAYAGQYANPYTYGGDPVNYVDPAGLFSFDTGLLPIGWTSSQGWSIGLESGPFSYSWNQDGSTSFNAGVSGSYQYSIFNLSGSLGYSYNSYSGHSLGVDGSACVGTKDGDDYAACAGVEAGGSEYWDGYGNYLGATAYAGAFAELSSGEDEALKVSSGYEAGFLGMEGRGAYAGFSAGADGGSLYAQWSENGGWSYGGGEEVVGLNYDDQSSSLLSARLFGRYSTTLVGQLSADIDFTGNKDFDEAIDNGGDGTFVASGHGVYNKKGEPVGKIKLQGNDQIGAEEFVKLLPKWGYKKGQDILLISCGNAILAKQISELVPDIVATGATTNVRYSPILNFLFGTKYWLQGNGTWNSYQNGKLIGTVKD